MALSGKYISSAELADCAIHIEQNILKENVGSQDQIAVAYGGFNRVEFKTDGTYDVTSIILPSERRQMLESHLMLFFTGLSRFSSDVEKTKIDNYKNREVELRKMAEMVSEAMDILNGPDRYLLEFGKLLDEGWRYKKSLSDKVSMPVIDQIYDAALKAGAIGGKILGAGGGGFLLLFAPSENQPRVKEQLKDLIHVPIRFENAGSKIVLYQPNGLV